MRTRALIVTLLLSTAITVGMAAPAPAVVHASTDATPMASGGGCRTGTAGGFTLRPCISTSGGDVIVDFYLDRRPTPNDCKIHVDLYKNGSRVRASGPFGCLVGGPRIAIVYDLAFLEHGTFFARAAGYNAGAVRVVVDTPLLRV